MRYGIIYKATSPSNKVYIGQTIINLNKRKLNHFSNAFNKNSRMYNTKFSRAIRKYGIESFKWKILYKNISEQEIHRMEISVIQKYSSFKNGYNSTSGGEGCIGRRHSSETKAKMSKLANRNPRSQETKNKLSKAMSGRTFSKSHKKNLSKALKGRTIPISVRKKYLDQIVAKMDILPN